ncbi:MAG TPA: Gfo/Idh/MocA family oxidoreductase, partial [Flavitalea sp.]|nr:Gfo/Idh/MocA family oxidoreductase [Flavitalea sp.]
MKKIQWGIIGCGDVTEKKSGPAFNKVSNSRLVAVMRRDEGKVRDYAHRHGVPKWYTDARQLIADDEVNAVYVATPPRYHEEYTLLALKAGKPVYVEKPMAISLAAAGNMLAVSKKTGSKLSIAHYRREQPLFKELKSLLEKGAIGNTRVVNMKLLQGTQPSLVAQTEVNWRVHPEISGGGLFHDLAPHQLDLMLYFFGKPNEFHGMSLNQAHLYEADDVVTGYIHFEKNIIFNGVWCFNVSPNDEADICEIFGSEGSMRFSIFKTQKITLTKNSAEDVFAFELLDHVQQPMIEAVVKYFLDEGPNPCSGE